MISFISKETKNNQNCLCAW